MSCVGYNIDLGCHGEPTVCMECVQQYDAPCLEINAATAAESHLSCSDCGKPLVDPTEHWDDNMPDVCPNCNRDQYFLEYMEDGSIECRCGWYILRSKNERAE